MNAVVELKEERQSTAVASINHHEDFLLKLVERNVPIEAIEKYMDIRDRNAQFVARQQFNDAIANFKGKRIRVLRSQTVEQGPLKGTEYANLADFVDATSLELAEFGLSAAWRPTRDEKDWIEIACILRHRGGHETETKFGGPPDVGGAKNAIQARASTASYLEKYTLKMALGIAERSDDDDGNGGRGNERRDEERARDQGKKEPEQRVEKTLPACSPETFDEKFPAWRDLIESGKQTHATLIKFLNTKFALTQAQIDKINKVEVAP